MKACKTAVALQPCILGAATALPKRFYPQAEMLDLLGYRGHAVAERMFLQNGMDGRYMALAPMDFARTSEPGFQQQRFQEASVELAVEAVARLITEGSFDRSHIGCIVAMTTYGFVVPSIAACLVDRFRLRRDVAKLDLGGSGCCGSVSLLDAARAYLALHPDELALVVSSEIGSQFMRSWPVEDRRGMVINALMGDAAIALVVGDSPAAEGGGFPALVDTEYRSAHGTLDVVSIKLAPDGTMDGHIDRELPSIAGPLYAEALEHLLARNRLSRSDIARWVLHPGSRGIIEAVRDALGLTEQQIATSRATLKAYGNIGSATALYCLHETARRGGTRSGELGILGGIGPGMTVGLMLLRWP